MEATLLGWPDDGPTVRLDYRRFAYAGKFVMSNTGKAVLWDSASSPEGGGSLCVDGSSCTDGSSRTDEPSCTEDSSNAEAPSNVSEFDDSIVAAAAFNADRTEPEVCWIRYITVASDRRGEGLGPRLVDFVVGRAMRRGFDRCRIAVNNPFAYEAMYKAGFVYTGRRTGIAELVLERPGRAEFDNGDEGCSRTRYQRGLDEYRSRDLDEPERSFLADRKGVPPPPMSVGDRRTDSGG